MSDILSEFVNNTQNEQRIRTVHEVEFRGTTEEYFGIWIVNAILGILTLGIYSAWAKIRNKKYFYGNTFIDNHNFDYHAKGPQILIGRIIVVLILAGLRFLPRYSLELYMVFYALVILSVGLIVSRALRFNARMSSYRNVRFNFSGGAGAAFLRYVIYPFLALFTLNLTKPYVTKSQNTYTTQNHKYGDRYFDFDADVGEYYGPFFAMIGFGILLFIVLAFILGALMEISSGSTFQLAVQSFGPFYVIMTYFVIRLIYKAAVRNIIFNNAILDNKHEFISTISASKYIYIIITNTLLAILTLGLMIPWGRIRLARYLAKNTQIIAGGDLDGYTSDIIETHGVTAAEYADMEGFDIDIGI